jgi:osmotically-inducible protein OsmY
MTPTNEELIKKDVVDQLIWDNSVDATNIRVKVSGTIVWLDGTVGSYSEKIAAGKDAYSVLGVTDVKNNLDVKYSPEVILPDDEEITQNITDSLMWNSKIISTGIRVETHNRIVTLTGTVTTFREKREAENAAQNTHGVLDVVNQIEVKLNKTIIDLDIEEDIRKAFRRNILIDEDKIKVECIEGVVRLWGEVSKYLSKKEAVDLAAHTGGVVNVIDDISIVSEQNL